MSARWPAARQVSGAQPPSPSPYSSGSAPVGCSASASAIVQPARSTEPGPRFMTSTNSAYFSSLPGPGGLLRTSTITTSAGSGSPVVPVLSEPPVVSPKSPVVSMASVAFAKPGLDGHRLQSLASSWSASASRHSELPLPGAGAGAPTHPSPSHGAG